MLVNSRCDMAIKNLSRYSKHTIFVCYAIIAEYILEWVDDLTTEAFLVTLRCFVAKRGRPSKIYSDNGHHFFGAAVQIKKFLMS